MKFNYFPHKVNLSHPFRYFNGVVVKAGFNDINSNDYKLLESNNTFIQLIEKEAIVLIDDKTTKKRKPKPEPKPEPVAVEPEPEIVPTEQVIPNQENSSTEPQSFGKLTFKDAIALINITDDVELLKEYLEEENAVGMRVKVVKALNNKIESLGSEE